MRLAALALKRKRWEPWAFASPSLVLIAIVILFPLAYSFWLSLQNFDLSVGPDYEFVGGRNYVEALFRTSASSAPSGTRRCSSSRRSPASCCSGSGSRSS
jgi:ABC-type sugar transport system permease subunit